MRIVPIKNRSVSLHERFGRLVVIGIPFYTASPGRAQRTQNVVLQCDCGSVVSEQISHIRHGSTVSCGCFRRERQPEIARRTFRTHGESRTRLNDIWLHMRQRCTVANHPKYHRYGGRGITVCHEWQDYRTFRDWAMSHGYAPTLTIDRIDNDGNYEPGNCRFITQAENTRRAHLGIPNPRKARRKIQDVPRESLL